MPVKPAPCFHFRPIKGSDGQAWEVVKWRCTLGVVRRSGRGWSASGHGERRFRTRQQAAEVLLEQPWLKEWLEAGRSTAEDVDDDWMG